jgi:hypothetical protein
MIKRALTKRLSRCVRAVQFGKEKRDSADIGHQLIKGPITDSRILKGAFG